MEEGTTSGANEQLKLQRNLMSSIGTEIQSFANQISLNSVKALECYDPDKVAKILYLLSQGKSQTHLVRKYGFDRSTIARIMTTYADHLGEWKQLGGQLAAYNYLKLSSLEEDMMDDIREQMESKELRATFRDLKEISIAKANASREALLARGEVTSRSEEKRVYTDEDYKDLKREAEERIQQLKSVEEISEV